MSFFSPPGWFTPAPGIEPRSFSLKLKLLWVCCEHPCWSHGVTVVIYSTIWSRTQIVGIGLCLRKSKFINKPLAETDSIIGACTGVATSPDNEQIEVHRPIWCPPCGVDETPEAQTHGADARDGERDARKVEKVARSLR